jgi:rare lipoprotein A (peptidoglycan hydrolase)
MEPKKHRKGHGAKMTRREINKETYKQEKMAGLPNSTKHLPRKPRVASVGQVRDFKLDEKNQMTKVQKPFSTVSSPPPTSNTSWGGVASWYDKHLEGSDTYHTKEMF